MFGIFEIQFSILAKADVHICDGAQTSYVQMFENLA